MQFQKEKVQEIGKIADSSIQFYETLLGYSPEQTSLQQIPEDRWNEFATQRGLSSNSSGIYLPRNQTAVIQGKNPLSLFHEYFGHGLYCEQSLTGRKLVDLEKKLLEEEKQEFEGKEFSLEELKQFRQQNQTAQDLVEFKRQNLRKYELFATWSEYFLSGEHDLREEFGRKYDSLPKQEKEAVNSAINFSKQYGNLSTFYQQGLSRKTNPRRAKRLLDDIYKENIDSIEFALLYGSKKEFSDIDVFIVGEDSYQHYCDWLDIVSLSKEQFEYYLSVFDVSVTDPITKGEFILGDKDYFENSKQRLKKQPITEESIYFNLIKSKEQSILARGYDENLKENSVGKSYSQTYLANSLALKEGRKLFTKEAFLSFSSRGGKQLKGGKEKNAT